MHVRNEGHHSSIDSEFHAYFYAYVLYSLRTLLENAANGIQEKSDKHWFMIQSTFVSEAHFEAIDNAGTFAIQQVNNYDIHCFYYALFSLRVLLRFLLSLTGVQQDVGSMLQ